MTSTAVSNEPERPALIGIDWGSSNLRAALLGASGALLDRRERPAGVFALADGEHASALYELCGDWIAQHRAPLLACGMIGSRQGLVEVPYVACPAAVSDLARGLGSASIGPDATTGGGQPSTLYIVPGVKTGSAARGWDVMRGEETQLMGLDAIDRAWLVLPGTHSKWMHCSPDGKLESFQTYMTGELFDLLTRHGSLARVMAAPRWSADAFAHGVTEARDEALENLLFHVRTAGLMERFQPSELSDYLSGLLIGSEIKAGIQRCPPRAAPASISVVGSAALTQRYVTAFAAFGLAAHEIPGDAVFRGLLAIARQAGLIDGVAATTPATTSL